MIFARMLSVFALIAGGHFIRDVVEPNDGMMIGNVFLVTHEV